MQIPNKIRKIPKRNLTKIFQKTKKSILLITLGVTYSFSNLYSQENTQSLEPPVLPPIPIVTITEGDQVTVIGEEATPTPIPETASLPEVNPLLEIPQISEEATQLPVPPLELSLPEITSTQEIVETEAPVILENPEIIADPEIVEAPVIVETEAPVIMEDTEIVEAPVIVEDTTPALPALEDVRITEILPADPVTQDETEQVTIRTVVDPIDPMIGLSEPTPVPEVIQTPEIVIVPEATEVPKALPATEPVPEISEETIIVNSAPEIIQDPSIQIVQEEEVPTLIPEEFSSNLQLPEPNPQENNYQPEPKLSDLEGEKNNEQEKQRKLEEFAAQFQIEAAKRGIAPATVEANAIQREINYSKVNLGALMSLLAEQAGINFIQPKLDDEETISIRLQNMTPLQAFMKIAQSRGFRVVTRDGYTTLERPDISTPRFLTVRKYRLKYLDPQWTIQPVANLLGIELETPADTIITYPPPAEDASLFGGSSGGGSSGGGGGGESGGGSGGGSSNIGLPTSPRWVSSLPYDAPLNKGEAGEDGQETPYIFIDRKDNSLVIKTTEEEHEIVSQYLEESDTPEPLINIETIIVEVNLDDELMYGVDWSNFLGRKGISIGTAANDLEGEVNLNQFFNRLAQMIYAPASIILDVPDASLVIRDFQRLGKGTVVSRPFVKTRSGVPVSVSSTVVNPFQRSSVVPSDGQAIVSSDGFDTITTGLTIDFVPRLLSNGIVDLNINPNVAAQIGTKVSDSGEETPIISQRTLTTSATLRTGMTLVMGGLTEQTSQNSNAGLPPFNKLPIAGTTIFGNTDSTKNRRTLLIFVTPTVLYPDEYETVYTQQEEFDAINRSNATVTQREFRKIPKAKPVKPAEDADPVFDSKERPAPTPPPEEQKKRKKILGIF